MSEDERCDSWESSSESDASDDEKEDALKGMSIKNMLILRVKLEGRLEILRIRGDDGLKNELPRIRSDFYGDIADRFDYVRARIRAIDRRVVRIRMTPRCIQE